MWWFSLAITFEFSANWSFISWLVVYKLTARKTWLHLFLAQEHDWSSGVVKSSCFFLKLNVKLYAQVLVARVGVFLTMVLRYKTMMWRRIKEHSQYIHGEYQENYLLHGDEGHKMGHFRLAWWLLLILLMIFYFCFLLQCEDMIYFPVLWRRSSNDGEQRKWNENCI